MYFFETGTNWNQIPGEDKKSYIDKFEKDLKEAIPERDGKNVMAQIYVDFKNKKEPIAGFF